MPAYGCELSERTERTSPWSLPLVTMISWARGLRLCLARSDKNCVICSVLVCAFRHSDTLGSITPLVGRSSGLFSRGFSPVLGPRRSANCLDVAFNWLQAHCAFLCAIGLHLKTRKKDSKESHRPEIVFWGEVKTGERDEINNQE